MVKKEGEKEIPWEEIGVAEIDGDGRHERRSSDNNHRERRSKWEKMALEEEMTLDEKNNVKGESDSLKGKCGRTRVRTI